MTLERLLLQFGLPIVFFATMVEGEATLILAGFLIHRGHMQWLPVIIVAALGSFVADQTWYQIGRTQGERFLANRPEWQKRIDRILPWLTRFGGWLVVGFRFLFGVRSVIAFGFGMSRYPIRKFASFNLLGALIWAAFTTGLGYFFGRAIEPLLGHVKNIELILIGGVFVVGGVLWLWHRQNMTRSTN